MFFIIIGRLPCALWSFAENVRALLLTNYPLRTTPILLFFLTSLPERGIYCKYNKKKGRFLRLDFYRETSWICRVNSYSHPVPSTESPCWVCERYMANTPWKSHLKVGPESCFPVASKLPRVSSFLEDSYTTWSASKLFYLFAESALK